MTKDAARPGTEVSDAIRIARVVCIFFMIYVHVHPGASAFVPDEAGVRVFDAIRFFVVDSVGRASVALLSVVAGYLAVYSLRRESSGVFLVRKTRSLILPLLLWNLLVVAMVVTLAQFKDGYIEESLDGGLSLLNLPQLLLGIGGVPANEPLAFLRDIFLCALFTPLLLGALRRNTGWFVAVAFGLALVAAVTPYGVRPSIPALYAVGMYIAVRGTVPIPSLKVSLATAGVFFALGALLAWGDLTTDDAAESGLTLVEAGYNLIRVPAALAFWSLALALGRMEYGRHIAKLEPYIFIAFCAHIIVSKVVWTAWQPVFGGYYGSAYPVFFFGMPFLVLVSAVIGSRILNAWTPALFSLLNGGRGLTSPRGRRTVPVGSAQLRTEPV